MTTFPRRARRRRARAVLASSALLLAAASGHAGDDRKAPDCPDAKLFEGGALTSVCWSCFFPITVGGVPLGDAAAGRNLPEGRAASECVCPGRFGYPTEGLTEGMWQPTRLVEVVRRPFCSPSLGGSSLSNAASSDYGPALMGAPGGHARSHDQASYYNAHLFDFPIARMIGQIADAVCSAHLSDDFDLTYLSELDPTWNDDELAVFTHPEAVLFATLPAQAACLADAVAAGSWQPLNPLFWCAGSWGPLYPWSGHVEEGSPPRDSSLAAARFLSAMSRRGLVWKSLGQDAVCGAHPWPTLVKTQHKLQTLFPTAEREGNHWIGETPFRWGEWRGRPTVGEDFVYLDWNWRDCCVNY